MSFLVPFGILVCSALWLRGLKSLWARAVVLASVLGLLLVLLPSVTEDKALVSLAICQSETKAFSASVASQLERGEREAAKKRLLYFAKGSKLGDSERSRCLTCVLQACRSGRWRSTCCRCPRFNGARIEMTSNRSLERTSTGWPRYAHQFIIASRGQPVSAPQLQR